MRRNRNADVQLGPMLPLTKAAKARDRDLGLLGRHTNDFEAAIAEQLLEVGATSIALATFHDKAQLNACDRGNQSDGSIRQSTAEQIGIRFAEQDRNQRRGVDNHQLHMPFSS